MIRIAVFGSGEGTNLQALLDGCRDSLIPGQVALVVSTQEGAGTLRRARQAGVPAAVARPEDFPTSEELSAHLAALARQAQADLVALAGFMVQLKSPLLGAFENRILNIHPALLPAFGGKGMYGRRVHEAVLKSGARVSGATVHIVDALYDHGPILLQEAVPVLPEDTPETLAERVRLVEHRLYPRAVRLMAEGRVQVREGLARILPSALEESPRIRRALLSVTDKTGLAEFGRGLSELGVELVATGGTAQALARAGLKIRALESLTGFPEILEGRVKTLHPKVHGGILYRRKDAAQSLQAREFELEPIDMVVVNLYPFSETFRKAAEPAPPSPAARLTQEVIEQIDIGGVALLRAAAKNFEDVAVVCAPEAYPEILAEMEGSQGQLGLATRTRLAQAAFHQTARYDAEIAYAFAGSPQALPQHLHLALEKSQDLRYGENPHQKAALYRTAADPSFEQLHGKELSYNNLLDTFGTWEAVSDFEEPTAVIFKHVTPCGIGTGRTLPDAFEKAWATDPSSAFGGVLAFNRFVGPELAQSISARFVEVVAAPGYEPEALELLKLKKSLRVIVMKRPPGASLQVRSLGQEVLVTEPDRLALPKTLKTVTKRPPTEEEEEALMFGWLAAKHVRSNAIVLASSDRTVGIGAGQMSRVDAVRVAGMKLEAYLKANPKPETLVLASDAFFPFPDGVAEAARLGVTAVIQPGGSIRDAEVIEAADELGLAMVFTNVRHFKH